MLYQKFGKRALDIALSALALLLLLLPGLCVCAWLRAATGESALQRQTKYGRNKELFKMLRLRTPPTPFGRFLRRYALDKMPALCNVLAGDMSLVGPAPVSATDYARIAGRDATGANALRPGLYPVADDAAPETGFAADLRRIVRGGKP